MLPGVGIPDEGLPEFSKGHLVSVCVRGNPCPIAVGFAAMSSVQASSAVTAKGKLVEVVQALGDCLWSDYGGRATPNDGFYSNMVMPVGAAVAADEAAPGDEEQGGGGGGGDAHAEAAGVTGRADEAFADGGGGSMDGNGDASAWPGMGQLSISAGSTPAGQAAAGPAQQVSWFCVRCDFKR